MKLVSSLVFLLLASYSCIAQQLTINDMLHLQKLGMGEGAKLLEAKGWRLVSHDENQTSTFSGCKIRSEISYWAYDYDEENESAEGWLDIHYALDGTVLRQKYYHYSLEHFQALENEINSYVNFTLCQECGNQPGFHKTLTYKYNALAFTLQSAVALTEADNTFVVNHLNMDTIEKHCDK